MSRLFKNITYNPPKKSCLQLFPSFFMLSGTKAFRPLKNEFKSSLVWNLISTQAAFLLNLRNLCLILLHKFSLAVKVAIVPCSIRQCLRKETLNGFRIGMEELRCLFFRETYPHVFGYRLVIPLLLVVSGIKVRPNHFAHFMLSFFY